MIFLKTLLLCISIFVIREGVSDVTLTIDDYAGEKFPVKYLEAEDYVPTMKDLYMYLNGLRSTMNYFWSKNETCNNLVIAVFFIRGILKRALRDDGSKVNQECKDLIKEVIKMADDHVSLFAHENTRYAKIHGIDNVYRLSRVISQTSGDLIMESLPDFNENRLQKWILDKGKMHNFLKELDAAELSKEKYIELVDDSFLNGFIAAEPSDTCLSRVEYNLEPSPGQIKFHRCRRDSYCKKCLHSTPSVAYGVSHRMLNMITYRFVRHCYWVSPEDDAHLIDQLCASMYREAVYIARRGYFARDLFLEHGALCAMMGYKEFYRRNWFHKALSWIDDEGCIKEFGNYEVNRTMLVLKKVIDKKTQRRIIKDLKKFFNSNCDKHPMAVLTVFLANAVRHALGFLGGS